MEFLKQWKILKGVFIGLDTNRQFAIGFIIVNNVLKQKGRNKSQKQYNVGAPFERIALDIAGPLLTSNSGKYTPVIIYIFSKWLEVYCS